MFSETYTDANNDEDHQFTKLDPLGLKHCMRFYPQDDNQGGFFVCVLEKILDEEEGIIHDDTYQMDAWANPNVRQKDIIDDLQDFVKEFEEAIKKQEEETGEKDDGEELQLMKAMIAQQVEDKKKEKAESKGGLNEQILAQKIEEENQEFPFVKLLEHKPDLWE